ncbi:MAG: lipopolysaccharide biosynthesis protein [Geminicoccaceae bacterium]
MHGRRQIAKGAVWRIIEVMGAEFFAFGAFIISARLLLPAEVGIVAQATLFIMVGQLMLHQGLGEALIQADDVGTAHFSSAFWVNLAVGTTAALALFTLATPAATLLSEPQLAPVLRALAPTLILFSASGIYQAKLRRELRLRGFAMASVSASLAGGLMAVTLAWHGYGVWSLVAQQWAYASISLLVFALSCGWLPQLSITWDHVRTLGSFGGLATTSALLQFAMRRLDLLILGYFVPTVQIGFFSVANRLMLSAGMLTYYSVQQIGLPVLSRLAHDPARHRLAINNTLRLLSLICLPTFIGLAVIADPLISLALGNRWQGAVAAFQLLSTFAIFYALALISGQILLSAGFAKLFVQLSAINVAMFLTGVTLAAPFGIEAAAIAGGVANMLALPAYVVALQRKFGFRVLHALKEQWPIWIATAAMAVVVLGWSHLMKSQLSEFGLLAGGILGGGLTFITIMLFLSYEDVKEIYASFSQRSPFLANGP